MLPDLQKRPSPTAGEGREVDRVTWRWMISGYRDWFRLNLAGDIDKRVHVRQDAIVPNEAWSFDPPEVPLLIVLHLLVFVEGQMDLVHAAVGLDDLHDFVGVFLAIRRE